MTVLTLIGGRRTWFATDWADLVTLTGASTQAKVGDRCWYRDGACWLSRQTVTTREAASKTRWIPELPLHFGANDRSAFPFGTIDDEGIVTVSADDTLTEAELDQQWDCLGLVFNTSGGAIVISPPAAASPPHCVVFRCVYLAVTAANTATISLNENGFEGGAAGIGLVDGGNTGNVTSAYHGQIMIASQGGGGGGGVYHSGGA
jgi:hypothetical protein